MRIKPDQDEQAYQFYIAQIDTHVLVENHEDGVVIRATTNHFSERRKSFFIRHLAAEGYIPCRFQWLVGMGLDGLTGLKWMVDNSWLRVNPEMTRRTSRIMRRTLIGAGTVWLAIIISLVARSH